ncbi:MAG: hypothetical protein FWE05_04320 [Defluviitaleaceae bacterium]|nr:hypothetical protein [Defluviitaleaceae bacterium]
MGGKFLKETTRPKAAQGFDFSLVPQRTPSYSLHNYITWGGHGADYFFSKCFSKNIKL